MTLVEPPAFEAPRSRSEAIVGVAVPIFLRFGYKKTSMEAVAAEARLSRQALYQHFPSKDALFAAVIAHLIRETAEITRSALWREALSLDEQLLAAFVEVVPGESAALVSELVATARVVLPDAVMEIDSLIVDEIAARLNKALGRRRWPVAGTTVEQVARNLQACSYGLKERVDDADEYATAMRAAVAVVLAAAGLGPTVTKAS